LCDLRRKISTPDSAETGSISVRTLRRQGIYGPYKSEREGGEKQREKRRKKSKKPEAAV
jgi:hypothetical protein